MAPGELMDKMHDWKWIDEATYRMSVPGGWLYRYDTPNGDVVMRFVPEPVFVPHVKYPRAWGEDQPVRPGGLG